MDKKYVDYAVEETMKLLSIDSPTGYTKKCIEFVESEFKSMGYETKRTVKGGLIVDFGGKDSTNGLLLMAHVDTIGAMVSEIKQNGRLRMTKLGGLHPVGVEGENCYLYTRDNRKYEGTIQIPNPSVHVNTSFDSSPRDWDTLEFVLDENVKNKEDVLALGISVGDPIALWPNAHITESGYIKSRYLDDKLSVGIVMALAKYIKDNKITLERRTYFHVTVFEEIGHGGSSSVPEGVKDALSIDMGCVGLGLECTERDVSICAKDAKGPYNYDMVSELIEAAKKEGASYKVDVYNNYSSDVETTLTSGHDIRYALIGPSVYASHCNERSHIDGVENTLLVLKGFLKI